MSVKKGIIVIWAGAIADIPYGWKLCDGDRTPDLRGRIILGTGPPGPAVGDTGGSINHDHDFTADPHSHFLQPGVGIGEAANFSQQLSNEVVTGTTDESLGMPPFMALAYIQRTF